MSGPPGCEGMRARLLAGVDLDEIREIERAHVESCAACRAAFARVEAGMAALAAGIEGIETKLSADEAVALAKGAGSRTRQERTVPGKAEARIPGPGARRLPAPGGRRIPWRGRRRVAGSGRSTRHRRLAWVAGPAVALAAAILGIVWAGPWRPGSGVRPPPEALVVGVRADAAEPGGLSVEAPETGGVAVFATRDPDIHVVWFYDDDRSPIQGER